LQTAAINQSIFIKTRSPWALDIAPASESGIDRSEERKM